MFKKALFTLTFLCALIVPSFPAFAMKNGAQQRLQIKNGKIILKNEADAATYQSALEESFRANDGGEQVLKLFKGAFALKGINDESYKTRALETIFENILTLNTDTLKILLPSFTDPEQAQTVQQRLNDLLAAEHEQTQLEEEQETARIQQEKKHAQEEADTELAEFDGRIESLSERTTKLFPLQGNGDSLIILQEEIDVAIGLLQQNFILKPSMSADHKQQALEYTHNLHTKLQKHSEHFQEQISRLAIILTSNPRVNTQPATQTTPGTESPAHEERAPLSPTKLREQRLHHFQPQVVVEQQAITTPVASTSSSSQPSNVRNSKGKGRHPNNQWDESNEQYTETKNNLDRVFASAKHGSNSGQPVTQSVPQTQPITLPTHVQQQANPENISGQAKINPNMPQNNARADQAPMQQPWYTRCAHEVKRCALAVKINLAAKINRTYRWLKQNPTAVKIGLAATVTIIGAYYGYKTYRR